MLKNYQFEKSDIWLISAVTIILGLSIYWQDTPIGIFSAVTGVICVILTAKGKVSCFVWGIFNCIAYAYIGYINKYYGEFMLNAFYYLPMQFVGIYTWNKHMNKETSNVEAKQITTKEIIGYAVGSLTGILIYGYILQTLGGNLPYVDAFTNTLSIVAAIMSIRRLAEQWILWILIDIASVGMWVVAVQNGSDNIATLLMWSVYLANAIWGYIKWKYSLGNCKNVEYRGDNT